MYNHHEIRYWQLQDAKACLSELVKLATNVGPQGISVRGKNEVVVISAEAYSELINPKLNLFDFMQNSPLYNVELDIKRDKSTERDVDL